MLLKLSGRLDTVTAPDLGVECDQITADIQELILDFADIDYVSSAGLRVLLATQKKMNKQGSMKLLHVCSAVEEVFDLTGFSDILTIEK